MFSIADLLERAKAQANIDSDYRLAKVIGISHQAMTHYRQGRTLPNESVIGQLCALSGDDAGVIAAQIQAARSKTPEAVNMWNLIAKRLAGGATTAILSVVFTISLIANYSIPAWGGQLADHQKVKANMLYIVSSRLCAWLELHRQRITGFFRLWLLCAS